MDDDERRGIKVRRWWCPECGQTVPEHQCFGDCGCGVHTVCESFPDDPPPFTDEEKERLADIAFLRSVEWGQE